MAICTAEAFYKHALFNYSLEMIPRLQKEASEGQIERQNWYSAYGFDTIKHLPFLLFYIVIGQRSRAAYYLITGALLNYFVSWTKLVYADPRPIWAGVAVQAFSCSSQYGNPSGHSAWSAARAMLMWLDYATSVKEGKFSNKYMKLLALFAALAIPATIMYSRLFLGVHSLDQVLFGCQIGIWFAFSAEFILKEPFLRWSDKLLYDNPLPTKKDTSVPAIAAAVALVGLTVFSYISYALVSAFRRPQDSIPQLWIDQMAERCPDEQLLPNLTAMRDMGEVASLFGCIFGVLLSTRYFKGMRRYSKPDLEWARAPARLLLAALVAWPVSKYMHSLVPATEETNALYLQIVDCIIPYGFACFWMFGLSDAIALKLGLYTETCS